MVRFAVSTSALTFANALRVGQGFTTSGGLCAKTEFTGFGRYVPCDQGEIDDLREAGYVVYSYDTPIAWRARSGVWYKNLMEYSTTTSTHQSKIFNALAELS